MTVENSRIAIWGMRTLPCIGALAAALLFATIQASAQSVTFDFEDGTDQGWGHKFSGNNTAPSDASEAFPITLIGGSNRMSVLRTGDFQEAERVAGITMDADDSATPFYQAIKAASLNEAGYVLSYDWYVDTSGGGYGNFLQVGTYINAGSGFFAQDFPGTGKDVELGGGDLASGGVFSGTVSETFAAKGYAIPDTETVLKLGLIINGDGPNATVHFDNISIRLIPEPASLALLGLAAPALFLLRRRSRG